MTVQEIIDLVPTEKKEAVKAELSGLVKIDSRETAEKLWKENTFLKSAVDAEISRAVNAHDERFKTEKLPSIVEDEVRKRNPPKDPKDVEIEKMRLKLEAMEKQTVTEKQKARALQRAQELGIPSQLATNFIGDTDEVTDTKLTELAGVLKPWQEAAITKVKQELFGNTGRPAGGPTSDPAKSMRRADFEKLDAAAQMAAIKNGITPID